MSIPTLAMRSVVASIAVLLLTTVHHVHGAFLYHSHWRLHVVGVAVMTALCLLGSLALYRSSSSGRLRAVALCFLSLVTVVVPVAWIGVFEGLYSHVLKNALYFSGASMELLHRLFPPPTYELPDDFLFESSGVLQVVPAAFSLLYLVRLLLGRR